METYKLTINNKPYTVTALPDSPLLWVIRDKAGLKGTKFGCGIAECGACTILLNDEPIRSCLTSVNEVSETDKITTIEGLSENNDHVLQQAWIEEQVPQCGYCQSGQLMSATALLAKHPKPTDLQIAEAMNGNICRCGTYPRIKKAIKRAAEM